MAVMRISNEIEMDTKELPSKLLKQIHADLSIPNPAYHSAVRQGRSTYGKQPMLHLYKAEGKTLFMPRGYGKRLMRRLKENRVQWECQDERLMLTTVQFKSAIELRDYQARAVDALTKHRQGGICSPCGSGKTQILLEAIARIGQPSLWVCHNKELMEQTIDRACSVLDLTRKEIGVIGGGKLAVGERLTVGMIQTLTRTNLDALRGKFGLIAVDEAHHLGAQSFQTTVSQFPAMYRLWVSATPYRSDGLSELVFTTGGPILETIDQSEVPTIIPKLEIVETGFAFHSEEYLELISELTNDDSRNALITRTIVKEAPGNYSLVLSDRISHLETLYERIHRQLPSMQIEILTGALKKHERTAIMERVQNREVDILLATNLAREGLDVKHLNRLFLTTPKKAEGTVIQEVGRVMRPCPGKTDSKVFDFFDRRSPILRAQYFKRRKVYEGLHMIQEPSMAVAQ